MIIIFFASSERLRSTLCYFPYSWIRLAMQSTDGEPIKLLCIYWRGRGTGHCEGLCRHRWEAHFGAYKGWEWARPKMWNRRERSRLLPVLVLLVYWYRNVLVVTIWRNRVHESRCLKEVPKSKSQSKEKSLFLWRLWLGKNDEVRVTTVVLLSTVYGDRHRTISETEKLKVGVGYYSTQKNSMLYSSIFWLWR